MVDGSTTEGGGEAAEPGPTRVLHLDSSPQRLRPWVRSMWDHRFVLATLSRTDFQVRYKRAAFGVLWSVALPLFQALVLVFVFSRFTRFADVPSYPMFVLCGIVAWSYLTGTVTAASTAIVDAATLTDKVWFPRAILPLVPALANAVGLAVSTVVLVALMPIYGIPITARVLILPVACLMLVAFCGSLGLVLSAMHVYFRDVKYLVQAAILAWFWLTPIAYPKKFAGSLERWIDLNPVTGLVTLFRMGTIGSADWRQPVVGAVLATIVLGTVATIVYRRRERLFVDLL